MLGHHAILIRCGVVAVAGLLSRTNVCDDYAALEACVVRNLTERLFHGAKNDFDTRACIACLLGGELLNLIAYVEQSDSAAGNDALFDGRTRCCESVLNTHFDFFHLDLCCGADSYDGYAACELCETLLELFAVIF